MINDNINKNNICERSKQNFLVGQLAKDTVTIVILFDDNARKKVHLLIYFFLKVGLHSPKVRAGFSLCQHNVQKVYKNWTPGTEIKQQQETDQRCGLVFFGFLRYFSGITVVVGRSFHGNQLYCNTSRLRNIKCTQDMF